jgi:two-component system response regulator VicR
MLTAKAEEADKVLSFELGADDYITKPFGVREMMARVMANLRRGGMSQPVSNGSNKMIFGELSIDLDMFEVKRGSDNIDLTRREFELVKFLATQNNQVFTREALLEKVWGYEYFGDVRTVDVTIRRLRTKLELTPDTPTYILTKRGVGYHFTQDFGDGLV